MKTRSGKAVAVIGAQFGDEGKGAVTDELLLEASAAVRFSGGVNAGHTLVVNGEKRVTHQLPAAIIHPGKMAMLGPMAMCDLIECGKELVLARQYGARVVLDESAPIALPYHKQLDTAREQNSGAGKIGTTNRGIGPSFADFVARRGLLLRHLRSARVIREQLTARGYYDECRSVLAHFGETLMGLDELVAQLISDAECIVPYLGDTRALVRAALAEGETVLFEGAQGVMLDPIMGGWPFVTSSSCTLAGIVASYNVMPDRVIGVAKPYVTRVGSGPFPTKLENDIGERLRERGGEVGATTGRKRDCGWLDLVALRHACRMAGITELSVPKLDVLSGFRELWVAVGYKINGHLIDPDVTLHHDILVVAEPLYERYTGWVEDISNARSINELPRQTRFYLERISDFVGLPIGSFGVGPDRRQHIHVRE